MVSGSKSAYRRRRKGKESRNACIQGLSFLIENIRMPERTEGEARGGFWQQICLSEKKERERKPECLHSRAFFFD
ncbi:hypothetical protein C3V36_08250 [Lachnospiraceae bacterium oral taxon 500]|nr:hypothetical protein C3V36_08250 [Lachnospiraceae bacterium oral taxon 500]